MAFDELAFAILRRFIPRAEMSNADLLLIIAKSYKAFMSPSRVNVVKPSTSPICIAELFHGPTFCFKDLGLSMLCNLISHFTPANGPSKRTLCVSTTGDTGPAAVAAVVSAGNPNLNIMAFYPRGQISEFQKKQMLQVSWQLMESKLQDACTIYMLYYLSSGHETHSSRNDTLS